MVVNELLAHLLVHPSQRVVGAGKVPGQLGQGVLHQALNCQPLLLCDARGETEAVNGATDPDAGGVDWHSLVHVALDLLGVHVGGVLGGGGDAMVLLDDGVEHLGEVLVGVPVTGVDAAMLVVKLDGTGDALGEGEAGGLCLDVLHLVPPLLGHVLRHQGLGGLDHWELSRHPDY